MGGFVCTEAELGFFFNEKRSASISSMSCAKINIEQKFGPRTGSYRGERWVWFSRECRTFIFFSMSLGSAAETSESLMERKLFVKRQSHFSMLSICNFLSLSKYLRFHSIPLDLVCQQTEDVIRGRCSVKNDVTLVCKSSNSPLVECNL